MPVRENREYRSVQMFDIAPGDEDYIVEGYATTFDDPYTLFTRDNIDYKEQVSRNAIDENTDLRDVVFLRDHEGTVFARSKNATLTLSVDDHGLKVRADLSKTASAREAYEEIKSGMYDQMSFGFVTDKNDYDTHNHLRTIRHIRKLFDVSFVGFPANPNTDICVATRSLFDGFIEKEQEELLELEKEQREQMKKKLELKLKLGGLEK